MQNFYILCFIILLIELSLSNRLLSIKDNSLLYPWKNKNSYYFPTIESKLNEILHGNCINSYKIIPNGVIESPNDNSYLNIANFPVPKSIFEWWLKIPKPTQMRNEPFLCDVVYTKKKPIFNNSGCQLPHYMNPSAPRCQTKYLKWICDNARLEVDVDKPNYFILPESNHKTSFIPPQPWLLIGIYLYLHINLVYHVCI
jgi:hypothetical protein